MHCTDIWDTASPLGEPHVQRQRVHCVQSQQGRPWPQGWTMDVPQVSQTAGLDRAFLLKNKSVGLKRKWQAVA